MDEMTTKQKEMICELIINRMSELATIKNSLVTKEAIDGVATEIAQYREILIKMSEE